MFGHRYEFGLALFGAPLAGVFDAVVAVGGQADLAVGAGQTLQFGVTVDRHVTEVIEQGDRFDLIVTGDVDL
ncbi:hypothetical protein D3C87_760600 [compost metagenome]